MNASTKLKEENLKEIEELKELEAEILTKLKNAEDPEEQAKREGQLQQVHKLIDDRKAMAS
jgi:hypothetical protein